MGVGREGQGVALVLPWILKISAKNVVFLISSGKKKQISPLLLPLEKFLEKSPSAHPWKKSFRRPW